MIKRLAANLLERLSWAISQLAQALDKDETTRVASALYERWAQRDREAQP